MIATGVCVGFLPHNFNPARIIMGDGGALLLGLLLAVSTSVVGGRADSFSDEFIGQTYFFLAPLAIPLLILGVPILDTLFAIIRRATGRRALATADKGHLHHRLMNLGHGHRRSVVILWTWTALLSGFVLYPTLTGSNPTLPAVRDGRPRDRALHDPAPERARPTARGAAGLEPVDGTRRRGRARRGLTRRREQRRACEQLGGCCLGRACPLGCACVHKHDVRPSATRRETDTRAWTMDR